MSLKGARKMIEYIALGVAAASMLGVWLIIIRFALKN